MKKHVHMRFEEDLLDRIDHAAEMLKTSRTDVIKTACRAYLKLNRAS